MLSTCHLVLKAVTGKLKPRFIEPFCIEEQVGANTFQLTPPAIMRVQPVFNVSLVQTYQGECNPPGPIEVEKEAKNEV